jgi:hypothetical protein
MLLPVRRRQSGQTVLEPVDLYLLFGVAFLKLLQFALHRLELLGYRALRRRAGGAGAE